MLAATRRARRRKTAQLITFSANTSAAGTSRIRSLHDRSARSHVAAGASGPDSARSHVAAGAAAPNRRRANSQSRFLAVKKNLVDIVLASAPGRSERRQRRL